MTNNLLVEASIVYLLPEKSYMEIIDDRLILYPRLGKCPNTAIDIFFRSLSENIGCQRFGVIMSGTGSDGTIGIATLKKAGGTILAQRPDTCEYRGCPKALLLPGM